MVWYNFRECFFRQIVPIRNYVLIVCCEKLCFYVHNALRKRGLWYLRVCQSVSPSHAGIVSKPIVKLFRPSGSPIILVALTLASITNSKANNFSGGVKYTGGWKICDFISETVWAMPMVAVTLITLIGSHRWRIDTCRFRWPWVTFDPDFKIVFWRRISQKRRYCVLGTKSWH